MSAAAMGKLGRCGVAVTRRLNTTGARQVVMSWNATVRGTYEWQRRQRQ